MEGLTEYERDDARWNECFLRVCQRRLPNHFWKRNAHRRVVYTYTSAIRQLADAVDGPLAEPDWFPDYEPFDVKAYLEKHKEWGGKSELKKKARQRHFKGTLGLRSYRQKWYQQKGSKIES